MLILAVYDVTARIYWLRSSSLHDCQRNILRPDSVKESVCGNVFKYLVFNSSTMTKANKLCLIINSCKYRD